MKLSLYSLLLPALLGGAALIPTASNAQSASDATTVSLDMTNVTLPAALRTLFKDAGIRNFTVDAGVQGMVNASLKDVPFSLALKQVMALASQPLAADVQDGVYHVRLKPHLLAVPSALRAATVSVDPSPADPAEDAEQSQIYKTGINRYDARVMADLITRKEGIILVPSNLVMLGNASPAPLGGPNVTTVGGAPFGSGLPTTAPANGPLFNPQAVPAANNVLPDGIKRIFALQSDNSLVFETGSPTEPVSSGNPFLSPGYNSPGNNSPGYNPFF